MRQYLGFEFVHDHGVDHRIDFPNDVACKSQHQQGDDGSEIEGIAGTEETGRKRYIGNQALDVLFGKVIMGKEAGEDNASYDDEVDEKERLAKGQAVESIAKMPKLHQLLWYNESSRFIGGNMKFNIQEIRKNPEGMTFETSLDLVAELQERNREILDVKDIQASGKVQYENHLYFLDYQLSYTIILASSRSMEPVELQESYPVTEVFMEGATNAVDQEALDEDLILPIEDGEIALAESVADNILLNIPIKVLTPEEEAGQGFVSGNDWQILTEEDYAAAQAAKKEENNPFAGLQGLFDE